jgi:Domain of unknown function (DUF4333)
MRRGVLATVVLATTAILAAGCGDDGGGGGGSTNDQVTSLLESTFPSTDVSADCPEDASGKFDCDVTIGADQVTVPVQEVDGSVELTAAVVNAGDVERKIEAQYNRDQGGAASAECGDTPDTTALVEKVGATFTCSVQPSSGEASEATVTVENVDGKVSITF